MGKLVCLMGKSSTGKDTIYKMLLADRDLNLCPLILYTTRPVREGEEDGREYRFVTEERLAELEREYGVIERRVYNTALGPWTYCTLDDGQAHRGNRICVTVPAAMQGYFAAFGRENVLPVYLTVDDAERLRRAIAREEKQPRPSYAEVCRRYLADEEDFAEEKLGRCGLLGRYGNERLEDCFAAVKKDLLEIL